MLTKSKIVAAATLTTAALGLCWMFIPKHAMTPDAIMEVYRETTLARECYHMPYRCQSRDYHAQRLALDELCTDTPPCTQVKECLIKHIEFVYGHGCHHEPRCTTPLGHFNAIRREQGLNLIDLR